MTEFDDVIRRLRENRPEATPLELDRIKQRARAGAARPSRRSQRMKSRLAILSMLVGGLLMGTTGASFAIDGLSATTNDASVAEYATPTPTPPGGGVTPESETPTPTPGGGGVAPEEQTPTPTPAGGGVSPEGHTSTPTTTTTVQPAHQVEAGQSGNQLPFTGFAAIPVLLAGVALLAGGLVIRRRARSES